MSEREFKGKIITRQQILSALRDFATQYPDTNDYESWLNSSTYKYAVDFEGRLYPPKHILSQARGISTNEFNGGNETNSVFEDLGFTVISKE